MQRTIKIKLANDNDLIETIRIFKFNLYCSLHRNANIDKFTYLSILNMLWLNNYLSY